MVMSQHERPIHGETDVWLTPLDLVQPLGEFDLDPCGEAHHETAKTIYTEGGLEKEWFGRVWLNPPYSEVNKWLRRMVQHGYGIALVFARMDVKWAHEIIPHADSVFFPKGRLYFLTRDLERKGNAGAPSMFLSFGETPDWGKVSEGMVWPINKGDANASEN